jgi:hypothetical protein
MGPSKPNPAHDKNKGQHSSKSFAISEVEFISQATEEDRLLQQRAEEQALETLSRIRASSEKWGATIAAVFGAFGFATFIQGRKQIKGLTHVFEIVAGGVLLAAFLLAVVAIVLAAVAAQGTPREVAVTGPELRVIEQRDALRARRRLTWSRASLGLALILLVTALAFLWYAPSDRASVQTNVLVLKKTGDLVCGPLISEGAGELAVKIGSTVVKIPTNQVLSVSITQACPSH